VLREFTNSSIAGVSVVSSVACRRIIRVSGKEDRFDARLTIIEDDLLDLLNGIGWAAIVGAELCVVKFFDHSKIELSSVE
jgi:hypothetical protein